LADQCPKGYIELNPTSAPVNHGCDSNDFGARLASNGDGFLGRPTGSEHILRYEHALAGLEFKASPQGQAAIGVALGKYRSNIKRARQFIAQHNPAHGWCHDHLNLIFAKSFRQCFGNPSAMGGILKQ
jgi:hypothetical protein